MALIWLGIVLLLASSLPGEARRKFNRGRKNVCERITIPECASLGYQWTKFPNPFTNISSQAATNNLTRFLPVLAQLNCTKTSALPFLCSVYVPLCIPGSKRQFTPPCREFCARSVGSCPALAERYGIQWPSTLDCSNYPSKSEAGKCMPMLKIRRKQKNNGSGKIRANSTKCCRFGQSFAMKNKTCNLSEAIEIMPKGGVLKRLKMCKGFDTKFENCCNKRLEIIRERQAKKLQRKNKQAKKQQRKNEKKERKQQAKKERKQQAKKERKQQQKMERKKNKEKKRKENKQKQKNRKQKKQNRKDKKNEKSG